MSNKKRFCNDKFITFSSFLITETSNFCKVLIYPKPLSFFVNNSFKE